MKKPHYWEILWQGFNRFLKDTLIPFKPDSKCWLHGTQCRVQHCSTLRRLGTAELGVIYRTPKIWKAFFRLQYPCSTEPEVFANTQNTAGKQWDSNNSQWCVTCIKSVNGWVGEKNSREKKKKLAAEFYAALSVEK